MGRESGNVQAQIEKSNGTFTFLIIVHTNSKKKTHQKTKQKNNHLLIENDDDDDDDDGDDELFLWYGWPTKDVLGFAVQQA